MRGRDFLDLAREVVRGRKEAHWRAAVIHAYYALFLECRDALVRWGRGFPSRDSHRQVRLALVYAGDKQLKDIGNDLGTLSQSRAWASYDLSARAAFRSDADAVALIQRAADALALLDAIDGDVARRAAAVASLPPP